MQKIVAYVYLSVSQSQGQSIRTLVSLRSVGYRLHIHSRPTFLARRAYSVIDWLACFCSDRSNLHVGQQFDIILQTGVNCLIWFYSTWCAWLM